MKRRTVITSMVVVVLLSCAGISPAAAATRTSATWLPTSMASVGDSITRAYDINWSHLLSDSPQYSWSTGDSGSVNSQYRRLLAIDPALAGHVYNDAKTGANMADLDGQLLTAASQGASYVTVLMGANDLCTSGIASMTPTTTFQSQFQKGFSDFFTANPSAHVYVSSLPNIYGLWNVLHGNFFAQSTWRSYKICQSMLSVSNSAADRQRVVTQEAADNLALKTVCQTFANCRWDNYAGYNFSFPASDISNVDYFHPNLQGQNAIAALTWAASYLGP